MINPSGGQHTRMLTTVIRKGHNAPSHALLFRHPVVQYPGSTTFTTASLTSMGVSALSTFVLPIIILCCRSARMPGLLAVVCRAGLLGSLRSPPGEGIARAGLHCAPQPARSVNPVRMHDLCCAAGVFELGRVCGFAVLQAKRPASR